MLQCNMLANLNTGENGGKRGKPPKSPVWGDGGNGGKAYKAFPRFFPRVFFPIVQVRNKWRKT